MSGAAAGVYGQMRVAGGVTPASMGGYQVGDFKIFVSAFVKYRSFYNLFTIFFHLHLFIDLFFSMCTELLIVF